jgi:MarR family
MTDVTRAAFMRSVAAIWETIGMPHGSGLILGHLMVCEPATQTQRDIADGTGLSAGTVSTQLRQLVAGTLVEKVRLPGERASHYQLPPNVWLKLIGSEMQRIGLLRQMADQGRAVLPATRPDRVTALDTVVTFFEAEWPAFMDRYQEYLGKEGS